MLEAVLIAIIAGMNGYILSKIEKLDEKVEEISIQVESFISKTYQRRND